MATVAVGVYGVGSRAPRRTSSSPPAASVRAGTPRRYPANTSRRHRFSASQAWSPSTAPTRCGIRSASRQAISGCCCSSRRRCAGRAHTPCRTSPSSAGLCATAHGRDAVRRRDLRALPRPAVPGRGPDLEHPAGAAGLGRTGGGRGDHHRQRGRRRDALHHVRSGVPVLVEADRDRGPCPRACGAVPRRPRPRWAGRCRPRWRSRPRSRSKPMSWSRSTRPQASPSRAPSTADPCGTRRYRRPASTRSARAPR